MSSRFCQIGRHSISIQACLSVYLISLYNLIYGPIIDADIDVIQNCNIDIPTKIAGSPTTHYNRHTRIAGSPIIDADLISLYSLFCRRRPLCRGDMFPMPDGASMLMKVAFINLSLSLSLSLSIYLSIYIYISTCIYIYIYIYIHTYICIMKVAASAQCAK